MLDKKIDIKQLIKRKDLIVVLGLVILGLQIGRGLYRVQLTRIERLKDSIAQQLQINKLAADNEALEEKFKGYKQRVFSQSDPSLLITKVSEFAQKAGVRIVSLSPKDVTIIREEDYIESPLNLKISGDYHRFSSFLGSIENYPEFIKVKSLFLKTSGEDIPTIDLEIAGIVLE